MHYALTELSIINVHLKTFYLKNCCYQALKLSENITKDNIIYIKPHMSENKQVSKKKAEENNKEIIAKNALKSSKETFLTYIQNRNYFFC